MKVKEIILEEKDPEVYKQKADEYWHAAQAASQQGDGATAERLFDLGALFHKRYLKTLNLALA